MHHMHVKIAPFSGADLEEASELLARLMKVN